MFSASTRRSTVCRFSCSPIRTPSVAAEEYRVRRPPGQALGAGYPARAVRRYHVTTFGCQMNAHDSERIKGMLESLGLGEAATPDEADVVVFNTCTIREKPDTRLAAYLGNAGALKRERPDRRRRRRRLLRGGAARAHLRAVPVRRRRLRPRLDPAPRRLDRGRRICGPARALRHARALRGATSRLHRERRFQAWVQVSMGCNSKCAYCIVPAVRGREQSRRPGEIVAEVTRARRERRARDHAPRPERELVGTRPRARSIRTEFGELLRACDGVAGIDRIRFTSPHPKDFREPVDRRDGRVRERLRARPPAGCSRARRASSRRCGERTTATATSASSTRLRARDPRSRARHRSHRRVPGRDRGRLRARRSSLVDEVRFDSAFTFIYSPRAGHRGRGAARPGARRRSSTSASSDSSRRCSAIAAERNARAGRSRRGGARRGPEPDRPVRSCAGARGGTRRSTSRARPPPGELVDVVDRRARRRRRSAGARRRSSPPDAPRMHTLDTVRDTRVRIPAIRSQRVVGRGAPRDVTKLAYSRRRDLRPDGVRQVRGRAVVADALAPRSCPRTRSRSTAGCRS